MERLSDVMKDVGEKGTEQWIETKTKTIDLYQTVLQIIREKERIISSKPLNESSSIEGNTSASPAKPSELKPDGSEKA